MLYVNPIRALNRKSKGHRFESCVRSIFRNAYLLQPLIWRLKQLPFW